MIKGEALSPVTIVIVRWEWLSLLAAQVGLSTFFLISVMVVTSKLNIDVVKSSNLAELFALHDVKSESPNFVCDDNIRGSENGGISSKVAKEQQAQLVQENSKWKMRLR